MAVMELCLDGLPAGKGMDVPVKKSISSVWEKCQLVFPGYRAGKVTELCMEKCKGLQHVSCLFPEKTVLGRVGKRAYGSRKPLIRMGTCCIFKRETAALSMAASCLNTSSNVMVVSSFSWFGTIIEEFR